MHLRQVQLVFHRASSILEDNASQHPVQSPGVVDVSPVDLGVHKGQKILVSVNVVLVLELHFNFISEDSDKRLLFCRSYGKGWRVDVRISLSS